MAEYRALVRVLGHPQTNNRGEIAAVVWPLREPPRNRRVLIKMDLTYMINFLTSGY